MQKGTYRLSKLAQEHLKGIKKYSIETFSLQQWLRYRETLIAGFQRLASYPDLGLCCDEIYPNGFYFHIGRHTAYFLKQQDSILIVAVLGQSQLPRPHALSPSS